MSGSEGRDPFDDWQKINNELKQYNAHLEDRPQIVAANKMDMPGAEENLELFKQQISAVRPDLVIMPISSLTRKGVQELLYRAADLLDQIPRVPAIEEVTEINERKVYKLEAKDDNSFTIKRDNEDFVVECPKVERMMKRMQLNTHDAILKLARTLRHMGIDDALRERGAKDGSIVRIADFEFEFVEGSSYY